MKDFEKMSFEELVKWSESEVAESATQQVWNEWQEATKRKAKGYFFNKDFSQLEQFYREHPNEGIAPWEDAWVETVRGYWPFSELFQELEAMKTTLEVILKKIGHEDAGISINQLARLKGGFST